MRHFLFLAFLLQCFNAFSQDLKSTVILYNIEPLKVDLLSDGTIVNIYGNADHFLKGYKVVKREDKTSKSSAGFAVNTGGFVSTEVYSLAFGENATYLSKQTIENLDKAAEIIFFQEDKKLMIIPYTADPMKRNADVLLDNRFKAILAYLDLKGVDKSKIVINEPQQDETSAFILNIVN